MLTPLSAAGGAWPRSRGARQGGAGSRPRRPGDGRGRQRQDISTARRWHDDSATPVHPGWSCMGHCTALLGIGDLYGHPSCGGWLASCFVAHESGPPQHPPICAQPSCGGTATRRRSRTACSGSRHRNWARPGSGWRRRRCRRRRPTRQALPPMSQAALFDQLARFIEQLTRSRPLLLALDNLHWPTPARALAFPPGAGSGFTARVLIVGAYRRRSRWPRPSAVIPWAS